MRRLRRANDSPSIFLGRTSMRQIPRNRIFHAPAVDGRPSMDHKDDHVLYIPCGRGRRSPSTAPRGPRARPGGGAQSRRAPVRVPGQPAGHRRRRSPRLSWIVTSDERGPEADGVPGPGGRRRGRPAARRGQPLGQREGRERRDDGDRLRREAALGSDQRCYWKVKVWDKDGKPSAWSTPGILVDGAARPVRLEGRVDRLRQAPGRRTCPTPPSTGPGGSGTRPTRGRSKPKSHRLFVTGLETSRTRRIEKAELIATADDAFRFTINGKLVASSGSDGFDKPRSADVAGDLKPGANAIRVEAENTSDRPRRVARQAHGRARPTARRVTLVTDDPWKSTADPGANWHNRPLDTDRLAHGRGRSASTARPLGQAQVRAPAAPAAALPAHHVPGRASPSAAPPSTPPRWGSTTCT